MSEIVKPDIDPPSPWKQRVQDGAVAATQLLSGPNARAKATRAIPAFLAVYSRASKKTRTALDECTAASVYACIAQAMALDLYPDGTSLSPVYIVPQAPQKGAQPEAQFRPTHRGISIIAARAGVSIRTVPVALGDHYSVSLGELTEHEPADATAVAGETLDQIAGVGVVIRVGSGPAVAAWVARGQIERARAKSRDYAYAAKDGRRDGTPWLDHPIEMAQAAAIRYAGARGWIPVDSPELRAALDHSEAIDVVWTEADEATGSTETRAAPASPRPRGKSMPKPRELPDRQHEREHDQVVLDALTGGGAKDRTPVPTGDGFDGEET